MSFNNRFYNNIFSYNRGPGVITSMRINKENGRCFDYPNTIGGNNSFVNNIIIGNSQRGDVYQYLGNTYYALGRAADALSAFEKALALDPENAELKQWIEEQKGAVS